MERFQQRPGFFYTGRSGGPPSSAPPSPTITQDTVGAAGVAGPPPRPSAGDGTGPGSSTGASGRLATGATAGDAANPSGEAAGAGEGLAASAGAGLASAHAPARVWWALKHWEHSPIVAGFLSAPVPVSRWPQVPSWGAEWRSPSPWEASRPRARGFPGGGTPPFGSPGGDLGPTADGDRGGQEPGDDGAVLPVLQGPPDAGGGVRGGEPGAGPGRG